MVREREGHGGIARPVANDLYFPDLRRAAPKLKRYSRYRALKRHKILLNLGLAR